MALEEKSLDEVCLWLEDQGFDESVVQRFREEQLDGSAIAVGLGCSPGPDWLRNVVPTLGTRLKVYHALQRLCSESRVESDLSPLSSPDQSQGFRNVGSPTSSIVSVGSAGSSGWHCSHPLPSTSKRKRESLPQPFPIPVFRQNAQDSLESHTTLTDTDRKYVVQTLATVLMTYIQRPSLQQCGVVAKALTSQYPSLRDDEGDGEHSWKWFLYYRCQNVNRHNSATPTKQPRLDSGHAHFYPPVHADDDTSYVRNLDLLKTEMGKPRPRMDVAKELMRRTFPHRWKDYLDNEPSTLQEYLMTYPLLKKAAYVVQEFALVCKEENIRDRFEESFVLWCRAIASYCKETQIKSSVIQAETRDYCEDLNDEHCAMMAMRCLAVLFAPRTKVLEDSIPNIMKLVPRDTPPAEAVEKDNNQPHIILFVDGDVSVLTQHFIAIEQKLMLESSNLPTAIFLCLAAHYIFNLNYHRKAVDFWLFIQEKIAGLQSKTAMRRNPSATAHCSGISRKFRSLKEGSVGK